MCDYDWADDARKSYDLAIREMRLYLIRKGKIDPRKGNADEIRAWNQTRGAVNDS